ncbi:hypothetical protein MOX01_17830 [Microbacterium oxydans]|nr:hypothetical protein MOX01_17830 [Microbacterium oxydans]
MRQAEWLEDRSIQGDDVARRCHQGEAELVLEPEQVVGGGHKGDYTSALIVSTLINMAQDSDRPPLRTRIREAGGLYSWVNTNLIRFAGPASVGPYEKTPPPSAAERAERACPLCGAPMTQHEIDRSGPKTLVHCP